MDIYSFIIANKDIFKIIYACLIVLICLVIVLKTHKLFHLSLHPGIRYFRNAFFFYGISFFVRYLLSFTVSTQLTIPVFEFFIIMAGFFLLYSLIWKKIQGEKFGSFSFFNSRVSIFYLMALIIVILVILWGTIYFMFLSQIILFLIASIVSFVNYKNKKDSHKFPGFYFIAMILMLAAWILNSLAPTLFNWSPIALINIYFFNSIFFLVFLYGVIKITKN
jgi:hypothetical protein